MCGLEEYFCTAAKYVKRHSSPRLAKRAAEEELSMSV